MKYILQNRARVFQNEFSANFVRGTFRRAAQRTPAPMNQHTLYMFVTGAMRVCMCELLLPFARACVWSRSTWKTLHTHTHRNNCSLEQVQVWYTITVQHAHSSLAGNVCLSPRAQPPCTFISESGVCVCVCVFRVCVSSERCASARAPARNYKWLDGWLHQFGCSRAISGPQPVCLTLRCLT